MCCGCNTDTSHSDGLEWDYAAATSTGMSAMMNNREVSRQNPLFQDDD